jgi:hypothetical protein
LAHAEEAGLMFFATGFVGVDRNPLDACGSGTFAANLPEALSLFDTGPYHDIVVFRRDNSDDPPFDSPELVRVYRPVHPRRSARSRKFWSCLPSTLSFRWSIIILKSRRFSG